MRGSYGLLQVLEDKPLLWVPIGLFFAAAVLWPPARRHLRKRRERMRLLRERLAKIETHKEDLRRCERGEGYFDMETYYEQVDAYLRVLDPDRELPDRDRLDRLIRIAFLSDTIFYYNSVDWFAAHGFPEDYHDLVLGLRELGLDDMVAPVNDASDYHQMVADNRSRLFTSAQLLAMSDRITAEYSARGGVDRVRNAVQALLKPRIDEMMAA